MSGYLSAKVLAILDGAGGWPSPLGPYAVLARLGTRLNELVDLQAQVDALTTTGWANYTDGAAPQALTADARAQYTNDGATSLTEFNGEQAGWSGNKIRPAARGATYTLRIDFEIEPSGPNASLTIDVDIGTDPFGADSQIISEQLVVLAKGAVAHFMTVVVPIYCLDTFLANGGAIGFTCTEDATLSSKRITLFRTF